MTPDQWANVIEQWNYAHDLGRGRKIGMDIQDPEGACHSEGWTIVNRNHDVTPYALLATTAQGEFQVVRPTPAPWAVAVTFTIE